MTSQPLTVDVIRHAESLMNVAQADPTVAPFIGGRQNHIELSATGESQACSLGDFALRSNIQPTLLFCSPAVRSQRTCEISAAVMGLTIPIQVDDRLQELNQGKWTNKPRTIYDDPVVRTTMRQHGSDFAPPGGQSLNQVADVMDSFFNELKRIEGPEHIWVHTHGVALKAWFGKLLGWSHQQTCRTFIENASISRVVLQNGEWQPVFISQSTRIASSSNILVHA